MWVRHKAKALFAADSELAEVNLAIANIDEALLPACRAAEREGDPAELHRRVKQVLSEVERLGASTNAMFDQLIQLEAGRDALTHLLNRRFLPTILTREIELSRSIDDSFAIFLLDIDRFKSINDLHGHPVGDLAIKHVAEVLASIVRSGDFLFRYGGEEFLVICVEVDEERAGFIAEKIRKGIAAKPLVLDDGTSVPVTVSIGIALHDGHPDFERLIERADKALYSAKKAGRNICMTG
jgi:diguanylate cyclase